MADAATGSPLPAPAPGPGQRAGKTEQIRAVARETAEKRVSHRNRRNKQTPQVPSLDGTQSDSVTNPAASPRGKKHNKQRQNMANGAQPVHNNTMGQASGQRPRPVSMGGPLLPATPAKEQAYAGPTFQASPAPSSLPMPKFFSRSVPNANNPLQARMEGEKTPEELESSPEPDVVEPVPVPREAQQSPLDLFFKADKEQKARSSSMLSPEMTTRRLPATEPRNNFQQNGRSVFLRELDGQAEDMPSPRTVPPKNGRPAAIERTRSSPGDVQQVANSSHEQRQMQTQNLKDLLFSGLNSAPPRTALPSPQHQSQHQPRAHSDAQVFTTPSPFQTRSTSNPTTPLPANEQPNYHYGNRNLSPLFQAARKDTPSRPSGLRQELPANGESAPMQHSGSTSPPQPRHMPHIDSNSFSRDYLNRQIASAKPASLPQLPYTNGHSGQLSSGSSTFASQYGADGGVPLPPAGGERDIRSMEEDLRRMLRVNDVQG